MKIMSDKNSRNPQLLMQSPQFLLELSPGHTIHGAKGFVQKQDIRTGRQRPGNSHPLLLSARKL